MSANAGLPVLERRLGAFEQAMILTQEYSPFNVVIALRLENAPSAAALRQALDTVQRCQPALRCAIGGRRGRRRFVPSDRRLPLIVEPAAAESSWLQAAEEELERELPLAAGPLVHARYRQRGDRDAELLLTFAHAVVDAASGVHLVDRLLALAAGEAPDDTPAPALPLLEGRFPASFRGLRGRLRAGVALAGALGSELRFQLRTRGARLPGIDPKARSRLLGFELGAEETAALVHRTRRAGVTLNSALCAAFLVAARRQLRDGRGVPARLFTMADLRPYLLPPLDARSLGAGWAMMRFVVEPGGGEVWDLARSLNDGIRSRLRRGEKYLAYRNILPMMRIGLGGRRFRMGEMAVSHVGPAPIAARYGAIAVPALQVFVSNIDLGPEYIVQSRLRGGRLGWGVVYLDTDMDRARAQAVAEEAAALLGVEQAAIERQVP